MEFLDGLLFRRRSRSPLRDEVARQVGEETREGESHRAHSELAGEELVRDRPREESLEERAPDEEREEGAAPRRRRMPVRALEDDRDDLADRAFLGFTDRAGDCGL